MENFILDNIEYNKKNVEQSNISLDEVYALLGDYVKNQVKAKYLLAGKDYSKISSEKFKTDKRAKDPRSFDNRALTGGRKSFYTDYSNKNGIDLFNPKIKLDRFKDKYLKEASFLAKLLQKFSQKYGK